MVVINNNSIEQSNESPTPNNIRMEKEWYENGLLKSATTYKGDLLHGECKVWYDNGQLKWKGEYKDGLLNGSSTKWYENGQLKERVLYKNGRREGPYLFWHENGQLFWRGNYKNGKGVGTFEEWYDTGELFGRTFYCDGSMHGTSTYWNRDGEILEMNNYKNGEKDGPQVSNIGLGFVTVSTYKDGSFQDLNSYHSIDEAMASLAQKKKITLKPKKTNGKGTWARNPYVFVYEFELL